MSKKSGNYERKIVFINLGRSVTMNIQSDYSYNNVSMQGGPRFNRPADNAWRKFKNIIKQKLIDAIPEKTIAGEKAGTDTFEKINGILSRPHVNRAIMGGTAVATQPWIDLCNKNVDDETRKVSMYRTLAKIVAGTTVGILVRGTCYKLVAKLTDINGTGKHSRALLPKVWLEKFAKNPQYLSNYKSTLSTFMALGAMVFTNFLLDAPLTVYGTNQLIKHDKSLKGRGKEVA